MIRFMCAWPSPSGRPLNLFPVNHNVEAKNCSKAWSYEKDTACPTMEKHESQNHDGNQARDAAIQTSTSRGHNWQFETRPTEVYFEASACHHKNEYVGERKGRPHL